MYLFVIPLKVRSLWANSVYYSRFGHCLTETVLNVSDICDIDLFLQEFIGNTGDADSISKQLFLVPVKATYVRIRPLEYRAWICMRVEVYGQGKYQNNQRSFKLCIRFPVNVMFDRPVMK